MNNAYKFPMNLQFFAEPGNGDGAGDTGAESGENSDNKPTYEQLVEELARARAGEAQANADKERYKNSVEDLTKKNNTLSEAVRERMTADEQAEAAKAEAEAAKDARIEELETEFRKMNYSKKYMGIGMDEQTATELAGLTGEIAEPEKFFSTLDKFVKAALKKAGEDSVEALIKSNPSIKGANGDTDKQSEAVRLARASAERKKNNGFNADALKQWM